MLQIWHTIKGFVVGAIAFVACPCHLPITLPVLLALTAGTALGTWLENNTSTIFYISILIFIGGLVLAFKWTGKAQPLQSPHQAGLPKVTPNTSLACTPCEEAKAVQGQVHEQASFKVESRMP